MNEQEKEPDLAFIYGRCPVCNSRSKYRRERDKKVICKVCRSEYEIAAPDPK